MSLWVDPLKPKLYRGMEARSSSDMPMEEDYRAMIVGDVQLAVRGEPSLTGSLLTRLNPGTKVTVWGTVREGSWAVVPASDVSVRTSGVFWAFLCRRYLLEEDALQKKEDRRAREVQERAKTERDYELAQLRIALHAAQGAVDSGDPFAQYERNRLQREIDQMQNGEESSNCLVS